MGRVDRLLPKNSGPFELAVAHAMDDVLPVPLRQIMDPATTPEPFLDFLAAHRSVDLWYADWSVARKRQMIQNARRMARIVGTKAAPAEYLSYVDATIVHKVSHPANQPVGQIAVGITPIQHPPLTTRLLVKVQLKHPPHAIVVGQTAVGLAALRPVDLTPIDRANNALSLSKAPETAMSVSYAHRVPRTLDDGIDLDNNEQNVLGAFKDRQRL